MRFLKHTLQSLQRLGGSSGTCVVALGFPRGMNAVFGPVWALGLQEPAFGWCAGSFSVALSECPRPGYLQRASMYLFLEVQLREAVSARQMMGLLPAS